MIDLNKLSDVLKNNNSFLLTTHVNPDADAVGSELALAYYLHSSKKKVKIINYSPTPYYLTFLDKNNLIEQYQPSFHDNLFNEMDVLIALDFNNVSRLSKMGELFKASDKLKICIDHHQNPQNEFDYVFVDTNYSATGHIIYDLFKNYLRIDISKDIAETLYAAIMTDTGSFRFERTTSEVHNIAGELLNAGVDPYYIYDEIYGKSRFGKIKLLGIAINSIYLIGDNNSIGVMTISQNDLKSTSTDEADTDGFVNLIMSIEGVKIGLKFLELKDGFKVSLRSKGNIPVHELAAEFGGGGHKNAAGIRIKNQSINDLKEKIIARTEFYFQKYGANNE